MFNFFSRLSVLTQVKKIIRYVVIILEKNEGIGMHLIDNDNAFTKI